MSDQPSRRRFLSTSAAAAATATAGCLGSLDAFGGENAGRDGTGRTLVLRLFREDGPLRDQFVVDLSETRPERDEAAFAAALDGESYTTQHRPPFGSTPEDPVYAVRDGTYYRLGSVVVDEAAETHPVLRLTAVGDAEDDSAPEAVPADELPDADERVVHVAHLAARARGNEGGAPWGLVERGGSVYRRDEAVAASELLTDDAPTHVQFRARVYAVDLSRERFYEPVYRATVESVAASPERMEAILRAQFVDARLDRAGLSSSARDVVREARGDGYAEPHPYSEGYREVLRALHRRAYLDGNVRKDAGVDDEGRHVMRYEDAYYDYRLRFREE